MNITGAVPVPLNQQCTITVVVSNGVGSSEPFILAFIASILPTASSTLSPTVSTRTSSVIITVSVSAAGGFVVLLVIIIVCFLSLRLHHKKKSCNKRKASESHGLPNKQVLFDGKLSPLQSTNTNEPPANPTKEVPTGGGVRSTKEPIYSDLGVVPSTGTKLLAKTEVSTVQYVDIESVRPKSKAPPVLSYDDGVVSVSGATVIGATGGDTNPPPIPDKKSKGVTTTGQETNDGADAARNLPHHVNDEGRREGGREEAGSTVADMPVIGIVSSYL
ncbi:PREDICTED: uncharacterized protein LOC109585913 [Amphimedon queenslandica]|uniref:Uncharacterized protein n=1 Tax=Amphimedon queenslandica TaxID=400682 RepID=A0AAN0JLC0_AMPQE|nr:PREDICTED: uncharacterized protein LOC109585913 [Amphimedon queenslandica]|eukprot:XP_019857615.1 PREDICTED: uncharacterized protein LOC109585913 [Amphimedon queenslandica]